MRKCPRCGKETAYEANPFRPFCSERCRLIDLGLWFSDAYAIPVEGPDEGGSAPGSGSEEGKES
jgi:hypothetical protein